MKKELIYFFVLLSLCSSTTTESKFSSIQEKTLDSSIKELFSQTLINGINGEMVDITFQIGEENVTAYGYYSSLKLVQSSKIITKME